VSPGTFFDWRRRTRTFEGLAALRQAGMNLAESGAPEEGDRRRGHRQPAAAPGCAAARRACLVRRGGTTRPPRGRPQRASLAPAIQSGTFARRPLDRHERRALYGRGHHAGRVSYPNGQDRILGAHRPASADDDGAQQPLPARGRACASGRRLERRPRRHARRGSSARQGIPRNQRSRRHHRDAAERRGHARRESCAVAAIRCCGRRPPDRLRQRRQPAPRARIATAP
jgi:hypothetical protein